MNTLKDLIKKLEKFSIEHKEINEFRYGFNDIITTKDNLFPLMYVKIVQNTSKSEQSKYSCSISLLELSKQDDSNSLDIISNMELIGNDIVSYFYEDEIFQADERNIMMKPLFNVQDDNLDGVEMNIDFISRKSLNKCLLNSNELYCDVDYNIPQRPIEPFLFPIKININGGIEPYFINKYFNIIDETTPNNVYNYSTSSGVITFQDNRTLILDANPTTNHYYPYFTFNIDEVIIGEKIRISFDYEHLEGDTYSMLPSIGSWSPAYNPFITKILNVGDSGTYIQDKIITGIADNITFRNTLLGGNYKIKISNLQIEFLDRDGKTEIENEFIFYKGFGEYDLEINDNNNKKCKKNINLEVPTPDKMIIIKPFSTNTYYNGANVRCYFNANGTIYINWGDGIIENVGNTSSDFYHTYDDTSKEYEIDVYGAVTGYYGGYYRNDLRVYPKWVNSFDYRLGSMKQYSGEFVGSLDEINKPPNYWYNYYLGWIEGDIGKFSDSYYFYSIKLTTVHSHSHSSFQPSLYGDIGTFLNGNWNSNGYNYKYIIMSRAGRVTYQDRLNAPLRTNYLRVEGYSSTNPIYFSISDANEVAQLIVDLDTWLLRTSVKAIYLRNNASPNNADEPLKSQFLSAKANLIADGFAVYHS